MGRRPQAQQAWRPVLQAQARQRPVWKPRHGPLRQRRALLRPRPGRRWTPVRRRRPVRGRRHRGAPVRRPGPGLSAPGPGLRSRWRGDEPPVPRWTGDHQRDLSTAEARDILRGARISKSLICVSRKDLGAPYETRARQRHEELCALLREHADIEMQLRDFFGELCVNPLCLAKVTNQSRLLVVDCHYVRDHQESSDAGPPESDVGGEPIERLRSLLGLSDGQISRQPRISLEFPANRRCRSSPKCAF